MTDLVWPEIKIGRYRHSKSKKTYKVIGVAKHSETLEDMVVYQAEYEPFGIWARPIKMFLDQVEIDGKMMPRFKKV